MSASVNTPGQLAAAIPYLLGFQPSDSLVIIGMNPTGHIAYTGRVDLITEATDQTDLLAGLAASWKYADHVILIAVCDNSQRGSATVSLIVDFLSLDSRLPTVGGSFWTNFATIQHYATGDIWPVETEANIRPIAAAAGTPAASRDEALAYLTPSDDRLTDEAIDTSRAARGPASPVREYARQTYRSACWAQLEAGTVPDAVLVDLLVAVGDAVAVRDEVLGLIVEDDAPDHVRALTHLATRAPQNYAAVAYSLLAVALYLKGKGVHARQAVDYALTATPGYSLAELLKVALDNAVPPHVVSQAFASAAKD